MISAQTLLDCMKTQSTEVETLGKVWEHLLEQGSPDTALKREW